ncbi:hypothetical protein ABK040_005048 [Willaertia magna]
MPKQEQTVESSSSNKLFTLFDIAGPEAKSYLKINDLREAFEQYEYRAYLINQLPNQFFKKFTDLIHRFLIYLLLESKPLFTIKESEKDHLGMILKEYSIKRPLQYLNVKEHYKGKTFYNDNKNFPSLFEVYNNNKIIDDTLQNKSENNDNTLQKESSLLEEENNELKNVPINEESEEEEVSSDDEEGRRIKNLKKKKKKIIEYVPSFISNYFLNITKKYFPESKFRTTIYNEIKFKSFEDSYFKINRLCFDDFILSNFITKFFNINFDIIKNNENNENTNLDKEYLLEIICRGFCAIGESIVTEFLVKMLETNIRYEFENDFVYFAKIRDHIATVNYLNIYCFSLLFTNDINMIQSFKDLTTLPIDGNTLIKQQQLNNQLEKNDDDLLLHKLLSKLPIDIHSVILRFIDNYKELLELRLVCKHWNNLIVNNNDIWKYHCYYTLISDSLFPHCDTQSLPFTKFEKRFNVKFSFTLFFTKIKPFLNIRNYTIDDKNAKKHKLQSFNQQKGIEDYNFKSCIYINPTNLLFAKGSTKVIDTTSNVSIISRAFQPDLPSGMKMKDDETFYGQLNCKELSKFFSGSYLPETGMIYIFKHTIDDTIRIEYSEQEFDFDKKNAIEVVASLDTSLQSLHKRKKLESGIVMFENEKDIFLMHAFDKMLVISKQDLLKKDFGKVFFTNLSYWQEVVHNAPVRLKVTIENLDTYEKDDFIVSDEEDEEDLDDEEGTV